MSFCLAPVADCIAFKGTLITPDISTIYAVDDVIGGLIKLDGMGEANEFVRIKQIDLIEKSTVIKEISIDAFIANLEYMPENDNAAHLFPAELGVSNLVARKTLLTYTDFGTTSGSVSYSKVSLEDLNIICQLDENSQLFAHLISNATPDYSVSATEYQLVVWVAVLASRN